MKSKHKKSHEGKTNIMRTSVLQAEGKDIATSIETPRRIEFLTELDYGSGNDGSGQSVEKALLYNHRYKIKICLFNGEKPENSDKYKWAIEYESPSNIGQKIRVELEKGGDEIDLEINRIDYCGCELSIQAYCENSDQYIEIKQFVHHRFRWFDKKIIDKQIKQRKEAPWRIDQGSSSLCGMAALYYVTIKNDPERYQKIAEDLHRKGECTIDGFRIKPSGKMYEIDPSDNAEYKRMYMWEVDWITLAGTRSSESNLGYHGLEDGAWDQFTAVNWPNMMEDLVKKIAGYKKTFSDNADLSTPLIKNLFNGSEHDASADIEKLETINKKYKEGHEILMMIDANMLSNTPGFKLSDIQNSHWIVYEGNYANDEIKGTVSFDVYTWGFEPKTAQKYDVSSDSDKTQPAFHQVQTKKGIFKQSFSSNHYGHIQASN